MTRANETQTSATRHIEYRVEFDQFVPEAFADTGVVHLPGAFSAEEAAAMRLAVWGHIEVSTDVRQHDPSTWPSRRGPDIGLKPLKGLRVFAPVVANQALRELVDHLFGGQGWKSPRQGPRLLLTMPTPGPWTMPIGWHFDGSFDRASFPMPWLQLWAFIEQVDPCGGGTLLLAGSHRLVDRYRRGLREAHQPGNGVNWTRFMHQHPALDALAGGGTPLGPRRELLGQLHEVEGLPVQAIELTGAPGDMFVSHGHTYHCKPSNTSERPRQMMTAAIYPASPASG